MNTNVKLDKKKDRVAEIHSLSHDGRGIATIDRKTTFIDGALPNETVAYQILRKHSHYDEAKTISILQAAQVRTPAICPHFGICGGCSLQYMSTATQLEFKQASLLNQLKHFGQVEPEKLMPALSALSSGYRRKARLGVKFVIKKNKLMIGFREKSSPYLADLQSCAILHPKVGNRINELNLLIASLQSYKEIPQIEVAIGDEEAALVFRHLHALSIDDQEKLRDFGEQYAFHIYLQPNPPQALIKLWPADHDERLTYSLPDYHLEYLFHPLDFTQINLEVNRLMIKQALSALDLHAEDVLLDLFCGIGNFTLPAAKFAKEVVGIEGNQDMIERAKANAEKNNILNVNFFADNLMGSSIQSPWTKRKYDKILLDPPRAGAKEILPLLPFFAAETIVYVSCNPATLARDAGILVHQYGYQLTQAGIMNMFPHTAHIEAMAVFNKK